MRYRTSAKIKNFLLGLNFFCIFVDDIRPSPLLRAVAILKEVTKHPLPLYGQHSSTSYCPTAVALKSQCRVEEETVEPQICPFTGSTRDFLPSGGIIIYPSPRKWLKSPEIIYPQYKFIEHPPIAPHPPQ